MTMVPEKIREETLLSLSRSSRLFDDDNARVFDERRSGDDDDVFNIFPFVRWGNDICVARPRKKSVVPPPQKHTQKEREREIENEPKKRGGRHFFYFPYDPRDVVERRRRRRLSIPRV